jgi:cysteine desulfurase/selenocysteine lyase
MLIAAMQRTNAVLDPYAVREHFPILRSGAHGRPLTYLDSAASSQKPEAVLSAMRSYYECDYANVHRGVYALAERSTAAYELARRQVAAFFGVGRERQVIFVRNTSEAINLVAHSWGGATLGPGDIVVLSEMEHHSNLVPWQLIAARTGATLEFIGIDDDGRLRLADLDRHLATGRVRMVSVCHVSNVLATINPVEEIIDRAHTARALVMLDGAQAAPHLPVDLTALDVDFYAASGHKMCGPMGAGMLYGKLELLEAMPPYMGGGDMIRAVSLRESTWADLPAKFEAGTPSVADAVGFGAACDYLSALGMQRVHAHEVALTGYAYERLREVPDLTIYGPPPAGRSGAVAFTIAGVHPHDIASILNQDGVCIRVGHHCAQPLHARLGIAASARASFYVYNTTEDVDRLVEGLRRARTTFDAYSARFLDHYRNPRNRGTLEPHDASYEDTHALCGDQLRIDLRFAGHTLTDIRFSGDGCAVSQASASMLTEMVKGMRRAEIQTLPHAPLLEQLDIPISGARVRCATLSLKVLKAGACGLTGWPGEDDES